MDPVTAASDVSVFSQLPSELIVKILDIAAASSITTALALCLVSSWARKLARPHLLDTVVLSTNAETNAFQYAVLQAPDCADTRALVRHLWVARDGDLDEALGHLTGLTDLAITAPQLFYATCGDDHRNVPAPEISHGVRLTLLPSPFSGPFLERLFSWEHTNPALLARTTHLSIVLHADNDTSHVAIFWVSNSLEHFPRLTHLAVALPTASSPVNANASTRGDGVCARELPGRRQGVLGVAVREISARVHRRRGWISGKIVGLLVEYAGVGSMRRAGGELAGRNSHRR
ncbi:hypothetical protein PLICRDRAFT_452163 [Plicaturopsis crispa FD-325 SS-3]|uniref:Unplaced genomic scaffold PLICRscaffold_25, whole genome shotgun sequence n=1 Tax=Plicaturopsis crispa FD-325 SS-3 TaxID=944288 RepID=A0A0C9T5M2_PLICR|nr:hypothetical protein PLICRDRAFT_452163 [Plicaturopsis crispa FD-325 SS-3]